MSTVTDATGTIIAEVAAGQYPFTPLGPGQYGVSITSATGLTIPTGATYAVVEVQTNAARFTTDGQTAPTTAVGRNLATGLTLTLSGAQVLSNFRIIGPSGTTMNAEFYK